MTAADPEGAAAAVARAGRPAAAAQMQQQQQQQQLKQQQAAQASGAGPAKATDGGILDDQAPTCERGVSCQQQGAPVVK
jgi:hypothetical protein